MIELIGLLVALLLLQVQAQSCNTNQNPYCRGNAQLEALCCPYPSVCYWSSRNGTPACCPAGQDCSANGGPSAVSVNSVTAVTQIQQTTNYVTVIVTSTVHGQTQSSAPTYITASQQGQTFYQTVYTTTYVGQSAQGTTFATITTNNAVQQTQGVNGVFITVTEVQFVNAALGMRLSHKEWALLIALLLAVVTSILA